jgi:hypothetical protein
MFPLIQSMFAPAVQSAKHVASVSVSTSMTPTPASLGALVGDMAVIQQNSGTPTSGSGEAFNLIAVGAIWWKTLNADDLAAPVMTSSAGTVLAIYRGAKSLAEAAFTQQGPGAHSFPGVTPDSRHLGLFGSILSDGDNSVLPTVTGPATWAARAAIVRPTRKVGFFDRLYPASAAYQGESFAYTGTDSSDQVTICEFRNA